ncbi:hypothetical protein Ahy_B03g067362 [Arachis hypogaea]|uniref:Uncharacterized protein n=1 Tax=Arachis hypogaea TaxID=3818 RepID=A0A445A6U7_ARAHY|nr:hypothetical protein Ahy_B03g067362 [Arachis hypogaea]
MHSLSLSLSLSVFSLSTISTFVDRIFEDSFSSDYDLKSITSKAIYTAAPVSVDSLSPSSKHVKPLPAESSSSTQSLVLVDSQENGIRLVHTHGVRGGSLSEQLISCGGALKQIEFLEPCVNLEDLDISMLELRFKDEDGEGEGWATVWLRLGRRQYKWLRLATMIKMRVMTGGCWKGNKIENDGSNGGRKISFAAPVTHLVHKREAVLVDGGESDEPDVRNRRGVGRDTTTI